MLTLQNDQLLIEILDPDRDIKLIGSRYCSGGQVFQITDQKLGKVFSGPTYPNSYNTFDSQGAPDAFSEYVELENAKLGDLIMAIGVGIVKFTSPIKHSFAKENTDVVRPLQWKIEPYAQGIIFNTQERHGQLGYRLNRIVSLFNRELSIATELKNLGQSPLPVSWFAHPFFPHTQDHIIGKIPSALKINERYALENEKLKLTPPSERDYEIKNGFISGQAYKTKYPLLMSIHHDLLQKVDIECHFPVETLSFWYNMYTFSPEPFLVTRLAHDQSTSWAIKYKL